MDLNEIQELIKFVARSGVTEVELEAKEFKIIIKTPARKKRGELIPADSDPIVVQPSTVTPAPPTQVVVTAGTDEPVTTPSASVEIESDTSTDDSEYETIKSPMIGTFYRSSAPDKPPFVNVGDEIKPGDIICIVEAMKLFNEIEAEISGKIVKVLVDDSTPVEYDQPIYLVEPH